MCGCSRNKKGQIMMTNIIRERQMVLSRIRQFNNNRQANIIKQKQALANNILKFRKPLQFKSR